MTVAENNKFRRSYYSHSDLDNHSSLQDIQSCHRLSQAYLDKKCVFRFCTGQRSCSPLKDEEILDHGPNLNPRIGIVGFKNKWFSCFLGRFFNHVEEPSHVDVSPLIVVARKCSRAPYQYTFSGK